MARYDIRSQIAVPAQGMIEFRDALTNLLDRFGTDDHGQCHTKQQQHPQQLSNPASSNLSSHSHPLSLEFVFILTPNNHGIVSCNVSKSHPNFSGFDICSRSFVAKIYLITMRVRAIRTTRQMILFQHLTPSFLSSYLVLRFVACRSFRWRSSVLVAGLVKLVVPMLCLLLVCSLSLCEKRWNKTGWRCCHVA